MILQLVQLPSMREAVLKAASQALRSERAIVIFECSQGRHRSVAAAGILYQILQPLIPKMKLLHASSKNWKGTCGGQCPECKRGPSQEFHDEVDVLRNALLAQLERDYMEPPAPAFVDNNQVDQHCKIPARQVPGFGCRAIQQLLDCLQVCPSFSIKVALTLVDQALLAGHNLGFFDLKLSSKNQQQQKFAHTSKNQIENQQRKIGRKFLECYQQSLQNLKSAMLITRNACQHKRLSQPRKMCLALCGGWLFGTVSGNGQQSVTVAGMLKGCHVVNNIILGGMDSSHFLDEHLFQQIIPLPQAGPQPMFGDFLMFQNLQEGNFTGNVESLQSTNASQDQPNFIEEPCSSPSLSPTWIGAQPDPESDYELSMDNQLEDDPLGDHGSCAPTEIDDQSSHSSATLPFYFPSPSSRSKKRKFGEDIASAQQKQTASQPKRAKRN